MGFELYCTYSERRGGGGGGLFESYCTYSERRGEGVGYLRMGFESYCAYGERGGEGVFGLGRANDACRQLNVESELAERPLEIERVWYG